MFSVYTFLQASEGNSVPLQMFEDKNKASLKQDAELYSMMLAVLGVVALVTYLMQVSLLLTEQPWAGLYVYIISSVPIKNITECYKES